MAWLCGGNSGRLALHYSHDDIRSRLYSAVLSDVLDGLGYRNQAMRPFVRPLDEHLALFAQDPRAVCLVRLALVEQWAANTQRTGELAREALQVAAETDHPMTLAYVITYAAILAAEAGEAEWLAELLAEAAALRERLSERYLVVVLDALRGWLEISEGSLGGIDKILQAVGRSRAEGQTLHLSYTLLLLARARLQSGAVREGRVAAAEALEWTRTSNQRYLEAELSRLDAELAQRGGDSR